ncbi:hypothetical protein F9U64_01285 [Gracilibacillus oryzae]|uniref:Uncharacterized protein n=1 Tax=Gracilibacillus oryzae TaxID=1672701 RepID=A0A7C8GWU2_9BACI|nr:hypothetical protein [Gracilibacillus oryzae]KAB8139286.1 hypothetical protein F9U64_01285 [Gracilibacillus oryzae]
MIPVIAFKNKAKEDRYLANGPDAGDWDDEELDVHIDDIQNAFLIWRIDKTKPTQEDLENIIKESREHKQNMIERFGDASLISYDVEKWLEDYEAAWIEITKEQLEASKEWN